MNPIMPTIGRNVYFYPSAGAREQHANIVDVHSESLVNLFTVNHGGTASSVTSVPYAADGETPTGPHWRWMPYQRGQALAAQVPQAGRPADVQLVKLEENGELTDAGREKTALGGMVARADGLGADATGDQLRASYGDAGDSGADGARQQPTMHFDAENLRPGLGAEPIAVRGEPGGGVLDGTDRTTSGAIGQP